MTAPVPDLAACFVAATGRPYTPTESPWDEGLERRVCQVAETWDDELQRPSQPPRRPKWATR